MLVIGVLSVVLTSVVFGEDLTCSQGELKNNGETLEPINAVADAGGGTSVHSPICGWQLSLSSPCNNVDIMAKPLFSDKVLVNGQCEQQQENDKLNCYCSGSGCNADSNRLHEILMAEYKNSFAAKLGNTVSTEKSQGMFYCALTSLRTEFKYSGQLPSPDKIRGNSTILDNWLNEHQNDKPNLVVQEEAGIGKTTIIIIVVVVVILLVVVAAVGGACYWKKRKERLANELEVNEEVETGNGEGGEAVEADAANEPFSETAITDMSKLQSVLPPGGPSPPVNTDSPSDAPAMADGKSMAGKALAAIPKGNSDTTGSSNPTSEFSSVDKGTAAKANGQAGGAKPGKGKKQGAEGKKKQGKGKAAAKKKSSNTKKKDSPKTKTKTGSKQSAKKSAAPKAKGKKAKDK